MDHHTVTAEWLSAVATASGGYTAAQFALLGVSWPPQPGWKRALIGRAIAAADAMRVEQLGNASAGAAA